MAPIIDGKPGAMIPMSNKAASEIGMLLSNATSRLVGGEVPPNMLFCTFNGFRSNIIWHTPEQKRRLIFDKQLNTGEICSFIPRLLWNYYEDHVYIYAIKEKPTMDTLLYKAPFCNINNKGLVCMGAGTKIIDAKHGRFKVLIESIENAFFNTYFTHLSDTGIIKGNLISLYKKLTRSGGTFPLNVLCSMNDKSTLKDLMHVTQNEKVLDQDQDQEEDEDQDESDD